MPRVAVANEGRRVAVNTKISNDLRQKLEAAGAGSGLNLSREIERRLEESFSNPAAAFFGSDPYGADLFLALSAAAKLAERYAGAHWSEDRLAARALGEAFRELAVHAGPRGIKLSERELEELDATAKAIGRKIASACLVFLHVAADPGARDRGIDAARDHPDLAQEVLAARNRDPAASKPDNEEEIDPSQPILSGVHAPRKKRLLDL